MWRCLLSACLAVALLPLLSPSAAESQQAAGGAFLKVGMIGLDTSHVTAFTSILNRPNNEGDLAGVRVVAAFPAGSPDMPQSRDRIEGFTKTVRDKYGVKIVGSIDDLLKEVDVVLLESVDGRPHLQQVIPVLKAGKKVFIDKPVAGSLADALKIFHLAREHKVPCFSSSSLRFSPNVSGMRKNAQVGEVRGCLSYGPCPLDERLPDLYWYGVHCVEVLYTIMGTGCQTVTRTDTKGTEVVTGVWQDGRIGTFRGIRDGKADYGAVVFGSKGVVTTSNFGGYEPLLKEICKFFKTGQAPVSAEETIELFAFMEAAHESKRRGGAPVAIADVVEKAGGALPKRKSGARRGDERPYPFTAGLDRLAPWRAEGVSPRRSPGPAGG